MKNLLYLTVLVLFAACNKSAETTDTAAIPTSNNAGVATVDLSAYTTEKVPGTNWQRAVKYDEQGNLLEIGYVESGVKVGGWVTYHPQKMFPQQLINYKDGKQTGLYMEFNEGGITERIANYQNNELHGPSAKYRFSRLEELAEYKNGKLDGVFKSYRIQDGKLQTSAEYKNGVQDGYYRTYNEDGRVTTEYLYKNGEQVSGNTAGQ